MTDDLIRDLISALAATDAEAALESCCGLLEGAGFAPSRAARESEPEADCWIHVKVGELELSLRRAPAGSEALAPALENLLRVMLLRAAEQREHRHTSERLAMLSSASFEGILIHEGGVVLDVNDRLAEMLGRERHELLGPGVMERCIAPEDLEATRQRVASGYEGAYRITGLRKDGTRFPAELQSKQGRLGSRPVRVAAVRDVTEREQAKALLLESERILHDLALGAFDFMIVSQQSKIVDVGGRFQECLGYTREQLIGRSPLEFTAPAAVAHVAEVLAEQRPGAYESVAVSASGEEIPVAIVGVRSIFRGEPARVSGFHDLRERRRLSQERRRLELQLQRSQRLDSLGVLAGGIAHDFNNLLVGVIGNASLLLTMLSRPNELEIAQAIMTAGERAAILTRQMLAYAGHQDLGRREPIELGRLLRELRALLDATLSKKAALSLDIEPGSVVLGDRATLTQVLMNLLTNASDALQGKPGRIMVRVCKQSQLDARWDDALGARLPTGELVVIEVEDDGVGMDEDTRLRVFEPFFTTKVDGHGLGLAACLGIVKSHGGALLLESELGRGSCFSVALPASQLAEKPSRDERRIQPAQNPCRVLVIDDEALVRTQLRRSLELRGYDVAEAADGQSGIEAQSKAPADVVVLDMTMPDMDGAEVVRRLRERGSRAGIVLSSGYQSQAAANRLEPHSYQVFLAKPYSIRELIEAVETARSRALRDALERTTDG
jgi:PAS domain S-box-containing protein